MDFRQYPPSENAVEKPPERVTLKKTVDAIFRLCGFATIEHLQLFLEKLRVKP